MSYALGTCDHCHKSKKMKVREDNRGDVYLCKECYKNYGKCDCCGDYTLLEILEKHGGDCEGCDPTANSEEDD